MIGFAGYSIYSLISESLNDITYATFLVLGYFCYIGNTLECV